MTELGTFDAVIFDFDGTLADSIASMHPAYRLCATEYGVDLETLRQYTGRPAEAVARTPLPTDTDPAAGARIAAVVRARMNARQRGRLSVINRSTAACRSASLTAAR